MAKVRHDWTKEDIKNLCRLWENHTAQELSEELRVTRAQISYMAGEIRKAGVKLSKKHRAGYLRNLINEAVLELKRK